MRCDSQLRLPQDSNCRKRLNAYFMNEKRSEIQWKWGAVAAAAVTLLAIYPQLHLIVERGNWSGVYAHCYRDESAYSAYLGSLINGRSRKNDPYTGLEDNPTSPLPESLFSIQMFPAYLAALPARFLGLSASTIFLILMPLVAISSSLVMFWIIALTTHDSRLSAAGAVLVLCISTLVSLNGPLHAIFGTPGWTYLPFLRRYVPAIPFPVFFLLFIVVWRLTALDKKFNVLWSCAIGAILTFLNFSYFYLWTAALAWLLCTSIIWLFVRPQGWQRVVGSIVLGNILALPGLVIYLRMLSNRSFGIDAFQVMVHTRATDLLRPSELLSLLFLLVVIFLLITGKLGIKDRKTLFVFSLLLVPFVVFNQQIVTGISLQPFHYEEFVTSYSTTLTAIILLGVLAHRHVVPRWITSPRTLFWLTAIAFAYAAHTTALVSKGLLDDNVRRDKSVAVAEWLQRHGDQQGLILPVDLWQGDMLPGLVPRPVLWAIHMPVFPGNVPAQEKERFYQFLYYSGFSAEKLSDLLNAGAYLPVTELFGPARSGEHFSANFQPVTAAEIDAEVRSYRNYIASFNREVAERYLLAYAIIPNKEPFDFAPLDRWYERDSGKRFEGFTIYRLKLRPGSLSTQSIAFS